MKAIHVRTRYNIIGGDYSGQEPRSLCAFAQDTEMQEAYREKKDLYAVIGSKCFHNNYEDNLEFHPVTHKLQPDGKARRSKAKTVLLGITYGMSAKTLAERMDLPYEEANRIINDFYEGFKGVKKFTDASQLMLRRCGYITDIFGRRRHIPDGTLEEYEVKPIGDSNFQFNPLLDSPPHVDEAKDALINSYKKRLAGAKWKKDKDLIIEQAERDGLSVKNNGGFINRALRQCLNARIQGSAASMTKLAMVKLHNDEELNKLGFKILVTVHDEIFGQAPLVNAERVGQRLCELMVEAANERCSFTPWSVDPYSVQSWYQDELSGEILKDSKKGMSNEDLYKKYSMLSRTGIDNVLAGTFDPSTDSLK